MVMDSLPWTPNSGHTDTTGASRSTPPCCASTSNAAATSPLVVLNTTAGVSASHTRSVAGSA